MNDVEMADVVIVGGGPAGLSAATALRELNIGRVVVIERETQAGGIPRHSDHPGYGVRDLRSMMSGPQYARTLVERACDAGAELRVCSMVTHWAGERAVVVTGPSGRHRCDAAAIVLATGARERPRSARMVPGDRPTGVLTTGQLQNLVHLQNERSGGVIGQRAVVVGAELVSWSAVLTLREAGCTTALMTSELDRAESYGVLTKAGRLGLGVTVSRRTRVTRIVGRERVEAVEITNLATGARRMFACDTVVFTAGWVPDNELARTAGLDIDPGHLGPLVDTALRTSAEGVFAAGNLLHPVDTADVAALDGRHVAVQVVAWLNGLGRPTESTRVVAGAGLEWVAPGVIRPGDPAPPRGRVLAWPAQYRPLPRVVVEQGGVVVAARRLPWPAAPGRVFRLPWDLFSGVEPGADDVTVGLS